VSQKKLSYLSLKVTNFGGLQMNIFLPREKELEFKISEKSYKSAVIQHGKSKINITFNEPSKQALEKFVIHFDNMVKLLFSQTERANKNLQVSKSG
jgi:hypothetical protein